MYLTKSCQGLYRLIPSSGRTKCHSKPIGKPQETSMSQRSFKASRQAATSVSQYTFQFIQGPVMDWSVDDSLYSRFKTWKLKTENIQEVGLPSLPDARKCRTLLGWSWNQGLDMYQAWCLDPIQISTETLWTAWEEFCKPQANEMRGRYDLLKSFSQAGSRMGA